MAVNAVRAPDGTAGAGSLMVVGPKGAAWKARTTKGSLDYPTQPVIVCRGTVWVSDGSSSNGTPNVTAFTG